MSTNEKQDQTKRWLARARFPREIKFSRAAKPRQLRTLHDTQLKTAPESLGLVLNNTYLPGNGYFGNFSPREAFCYFSYLSTLNIEVKVCNLQTTETKHNPVRNCIQSGQKQNNKK